MSTIKFYSKKPAQPFISPVSGFYRSERAARVAIERNASHSLSSPWIQLVREDDGGYEIVAEYKNHDAPGWVSPMTAAGMK